MNTPVFYAQWWAGCTLIFCICIDLVDFLWFKILNLVYYFLGRKGVSEK